MKGGINKGADKNKPIKIKKIESLCNHNNKEDEMPEYPIAGPRMAVAPDGSIHFYDEEGTEIKSLKKVTGDKFIDLVNDNNLRHIRHVSVYFFDPSSECRIVIDIPPYGTFCFWVDCVTGKYIRPC